MDTSLRTITEPVVGDRGAWLEKVAAAAERAAQDLRVLPEPRPGLLADLEELRYRLLAELNARSSEHLALVSPPKNGANV
jgi:hypothetical protein